MFINKDNITANKDDISSNSDKIENNETNISSNLEKIDKINTSKTYLKNIYNILFYDKKAQIDFRILFYEKLFDVNAKQNDFIEMNFRISLEYESISEQSYVKTIYKILDENDDSLYVK